MHPYSRRKHRYHAAVSLQGFQTVKQTCSHHNQPEACALLRTIARPGSLYSYTGLPTARRLTVKICTLLSFDETFQIMPQMYSLHTAQKSSHITTSQLAIPH
ncbi:hypothetical protein CHS0354_009804 [Potamilus streckersoni]|uniref:Uncharacterized protein n=1 Tax=Potamilus streckersoni TaxID=2493646 RepID=A0AAE0SX99_9BIVA|nr:hypothetical protein CHS0354_009804 [Potamilus streckersoni]